MKKKLEIVKCPYCGKSHFREDYYTSTCLGWTSVVQDGVRYDNDPNIHTTHCTCLKCGGEFSFDNKGGLYKGKTPEEVKQSMSNFSLSSPIDLTSPLQVTSLKNYKSPSLIVNCEEIHLTQGKLEIIIDNDRIKDFDTIKINNRTYKFKEVTEND